MSSLHQMIIEVVMHRMVIGQEYLQNVVVHPFFAKEMGQAPIY